MAGEAKGEEQAQEGVEGGSEGHGDAIRSGKTVGGDGGAEGTRKKYSEMREEEKGRPENSGANGEVVLQVTGRRSKIGARLIVFVEARAAETLVGVAVILREIEIVLDERSARKSVIADAIAANPRVQQRKREKKEKKKQAL